MTVTSLDGLTPYQQLRVFNEVTGAAIRLKSYDRIERVVISPGMAALMVTTHRYTESPSTVRLTHRGVRLVSATPATGVSDVTSWDPTFQPLVVDQRFDGKTVDEWTSSLEWAALCERPGRGRLGQRDYDQVQREVARAYNRVHGTGAWEGDY